MILHQFTRFHLSAIAFLLSSLSLYAQDADCGFDALLHHQMAANPIVQKRYSELEHSRYRHFSVVKPAEARTAGAPRVLPVVFHIVHQNGPENISDARIQRELDQLNAAYAHLGYYGQGTGAATPFQFCLARRDPEGQPSTGINRVESPLTRSLFMVDDAALKSLIHWDGIQYINIWVIGEVLTPEQPGRLLGYATSPAAHGLPQDGIVVRAGWVGADDARSSVLIHEMGHYLGLLHTFQGGCLNDDCLSDGDGVCDTPPDQSTSRPSCGVIQNSCSTDAFSGFSTDQNDLSDNFMDYLRLECQRSFTPGQSERMEYLTETYRSSLFDSPGCQEPCPASPLAGFIFDPGSVVDAGALVNCTNTTTNGAVAQWSINDSVVGNNWNYSFQPDVPGRYILQLSVTGTTENCIDRFQDTLIVQCPLQPVFSFQPDQPYAGQNIVFTAAPTTTVSWEWTVNGQLVGQSQQLSIALPDEEAYSVCLRLSNAYCSSTWCQPVQCLSTDTCRSNIFKKISGQHTLYALQKLPDNSRFIAGHRLQDSTLLLRISPSGALLFKRLVDFLPGEKESPAEIITDSEGYLVGVGVPSALNTQKIFAFKYDYNADSFLWVRHYTMNNLNFTGSPGETKIAELPDKSRYFISLPRGVNNSQGVHLKVDKQTGDLLEGNYWNDLDQSIIHRDLLTTGDRLYAVGHVQTTDFSQGIGLLLTAFTGSGQVLWQKAYSNPGQRMFGLDLKEKDGYLYLLGRPESAGANFQVLKTNLDGNLIWAKSLEIPIQENSFPFSGNALFPTNDGVIVVLYHESSLNAPEPYCYFYKFNTEGVLVWKKTLEFPGFFVLGQIEVDGKDIWMTGGYFSGVFTPMVLRLDFEKPFESNCLRYYSAATDVVTSLYITTIDRDFLPVFPVSVEQVGWMPEKFSTNLTLTDVCPAALICPEICDNGLDDDSDGYVDCYDAECPCFALPACAGSATANIDGKPGRQSSVEVYAAAGIPVVGDLNPEGDGIPEILAVAGTGTFATEIHIYHGDGANWAHPDILPLPDGLQTDMANPPALGDVDGDGRPELAIVDDQGFIHLFRYYTPGATPPMEHWVRSNLRAASGQKRPQLADLDGDGKAEIYAGNHIFQLNLNQPNNPQLLRVLTFSGADGSFRDGIDSDRRYSAPTVADMLAEADCNGDPDCAGLELVAGNTIYSVDLHPFDGDGVSIKQARKLTGTEWGDGYTAVGDLDLDGTPDAVVASRRKTGAISEWGIYIWDKNGFKAFFPFPVSGITNGGGIPVIAQVYDERQHGYSDDFPEIVIACWGQLVCYNLHLAGQNPIGSPWLWTRDLNHPDAASICSAFDFNGDATPEIILRDGDRLRVLYGGAAPYPNGVDSERNWWSAPCRSGGADAYAVVADVDRDGQAEITLIGQDSLNTGQNAHFLQTYESVGGAWASSSDIWNQFNYSAIQIEKGLKIPVQQQKHWLEFPEPGSSKYPYHHHITQTPVFYPGYQPAHLLPDAAVSADSVYCRLDGLFIDLRVCNLGVAGIADSLPVHFYSEDPTLSAATPLSVTRQVSSHLAPDSCCKVTLELPLTHHQQLWGVLNAGGGHNGPLDLSNNFQAAVGSECAYENNLFHIQTPHRVPLVDLGPDTLLCRESVLILNAASEYAAYRWLDGYTGENYTIDAAGKYWIDVWDGCGNLSSDTISIESLDPPRDTQTIWIPAGQSVALGGQTYFEPGVVLLSRPGENGSCDSLITYLLKAQPVVESDTACDTKRPAGCFQFELLGVQTDALGQRIYRLRVKQFCDDRLQYVCVQLPSGVTAVYPGQGSQYITAGGGAYLVQNPNFSPFYSIRFRSVNPGLIGGQSDIFEFALPQQAAPEYLLVYAKLAGGGTSEAYLNTFHCPEESLSDERNEGTGRTGDCLSIGPNPSAGRLNVQLFAKETAPLRIQIADALGQRVGEIEIPAGASNTHIDFPGELPAGWYFLSASPGGCKSVVQRVLLVR